jgi:hypothetical protein
MKLIIVVVLLFSFSMCSNKPKVDRGHHAKDAIDTTYYIGKYGYHVNIFPSAATSFMDTMWLVRFKDDSVLFRIREVYYFDFLDSTSDIAYAGSIFKISPSGNYIFKMETPEDTAITLINLFAGDSCRYVHAYITDNGRAIREGYFFGKKMQTIKR